MYVANEIFKYKKKTYHNQCHKNGELSIESNSTQYVFDSTYKYELLQLILVRITLIRGVMYQYDIIYETYLTECILRISHLASFCDTNFNSPRMSAPKLSMKLSTFKNAFKFFL